MELPYSVQNMALAGCCLVRMNALNRSSILLTVLLHQIGLAQTPEWIWFQKSSTAETRFFRSAFDLKEAPKKADLTATADDAFEAWVNGELVLKSATWSEPVKTDVTKHLRVGANVLAIRARNADQSPAGVLARLDLTISGVKSARVSDASWKAAATTTGEWTKPVFDDSTWRPAKSLGKSGVDPWGNVFETRPSGQAAKREATPVSAIFSLPGFQVELIHTAEPEEGSWVNLAKDDKGRLLLSPQWPKAANPEEQAQRGLVRVTLDAGGKVAKREIIAKPLYDAQGLLFHKGAIYAVVNQYSASFGSGLYRLRDKGNDQYDDIQLLKKFGGGGEHGPHAVVLGPDDHLYILCGNHTKVPDGVEPSSPMRNYAEDLLLPRQWDGNGHAAGILAPGGYVVRTDPEGVKWELFCAGFRNPYDLAFNTSGELFTFDADMEWDWGMPWYRPTRVNHCVSGGEYGWRSGTGKWPDDHADSLGAIDIGLGCPTGIGFGTGAKFPPKYQRSLFVMDWTYGRLLAVHMDSQGASYTGTYENFVCPLGLAKPGAPKAPLNITDLVIGNDGAMYFTTGGRGVQSGLYRVQYTGSESVVTARGDLDAGVEARALRRQIEVFHGKPDPKAVPFLWTHLNSEDRAIRFAARVALESQPLSEWKDRALAETKPWAALTALMALARTGNKELQPALFEALQKFPTSSLPEDQALTKLRVIQLSCIRQGKPSPERARLGVERLGPLFPGQSTRMNHELAQLLIYLDDPTIVAKVLTMMDKAETQEQQIDYLFHLRSAKIWTSEQRRDYFAYYKKDRSGMKHPGSVNRWFEEAGRPYGDGASFENFLKNFQKEALDLMPADDRARVESTLSKAVDSSPQNAPSSTFPQPRARSFVKDWALGDLVPLLEQAGRARSFGKGRQTFVDAQCIACHKVGREGGGTGPDLTAVASRFTRRDVLESILEPSKVVSEQFQHTTLELRNGDDITGRVVNETAEKLTLQPNPLQPEFVDIQKTEVRARAFSKLSPMPEGLVSVVSKEDILDLLAFIESGGQPNHAVFKK